ncbi:hypothetical protein RJ53_09935 [Methanocalculus chunghsingensis]|uniref:Lipoprotein n=1 Tax=Methanocalculus chunghsingensis TaxID=156457 RepID=A0A8J8B4V4_9EURY|nr:hypothetical protein [Methanocalculus chunghsingensis]MBR1369775.1 hypothetical protein [Methanocalculus chunghsingensis]
MKKLMIVILTGIVILGAVAGAGCSTQAETELPIAPTSTAQPEITQPEETNTPVIVQQKKDEPIELTVFTQKNRDDDGFMTTTNFTRFEANRSLTVEMEIAGFWTDPRIDGIEPRDVMIYVFSDAFNPKWLNNLKENSADDEFRAFIEDCAVTKVVLHFIDKQSGKLLGAATMTGPDPWSEADVHTTWERILYKKIPKWMTSTTHD